MSQTDHKTSCAAAAVQRFIRRESLEAASRDLGVPVHKSCTRLSEWPNRFLAVAENALKVSEQGLRDDEIARLRAVIGKSTVENDLLQEKIERLESGVPFYLRRSRN